MTDKVALVTGAGSGIGKASALLLSSHGYSIGALGHTQDEIDATVRDIEANGGRAIALLADIASETEMRNSVQDLVNNFGGVDAVIANAGINGVWAPIDDLKPDEWAKTIETNLTGTYLTIHVTVPHLKKAGGGSIVVVSSINGTRTFTTPGATAYTATKAAQVAMVQQLALELARHEIRINAVCPGEIDTSIEANTELRNEDETAIPVIWPDGQVPITGGKPGRSKDVAAVVGFLVSDGARHMTGAPLWVDGGQGLLR
jgi:NAD(P)-dependent dehydrogenase (short-subunit alcohol dehydrogenase family)